LPHRNESNILCLSVGNTSYRWAMHRGLQENFTPCVFWKTPPVTAEEINDFEPSVVLASHIPAQIHKEVFGDSVDGLAPATKNKASAYAAAQGTPTWTIYIISTNRDHERGVLFLFSELVCRVFRLENTDFFSKEDGCYTTLGVDRAACLFSGYKSGFHPLLVMDAGTAWTYTALDSNGKIMGGGISPGIGARFRCLSDYCGKLPNLDYRDYERVLTAIAEGKSGPLPAFATDTKTAIMSSIFQEVSAHGRNIIQQFLEELKRRQAPETTQDGEDKEAKDRSKPAVILTGGDAGLLLQFLTKPGKFIADQHGTKLSPDDIELIETKHLSAYGIGNLIQSKTSQLSAPTPDEKLRELVTGQRVAKKFEVPDLDGDLIYRGSVIQVLPGKNGVDDDLFSIRYDDGDGEELSLVEVYEALKMYTEVGEKVSADALIWTENRRAERKKGSEASANQLLAEVPKLKEKLEINAEKALAKAQAESTAVAAISEVKNNIPPPAPSPKRPRESTTSTPKSRGRSKKVKPAPEKEASGKQYLDMKVAKYFTLENDEGQMEDVLFLGKVQTYDRKSKFWHIVYEDGDEEDFDEEDLKKGIALYIEKCGKAPGTSKEATPVPADGAAKVETPRKDKTVGVVS